MLNLPASERHREAIKEIEVINKMGEKFQGELAQIYESYTDEEIKTIAPELYRRSPNEKRGTLDRVTLEAISKKLETELIKKATNVKLPLGD